MCRITAAGSAPYNTQTQQQLLLSPPVLSPSSAFHGPSLSRYTLKCLNRLNRNFLGDKSELEQHSEARTPVVLAASRQSSKKGRLAICKAESIACNTLMIPVPSNVSVCQVLEHSLVTFLTVATRRSRGLQAGVHAARNNTNTLLNCSCSSFGLQTVMAVALWLTVNGQHAQGCCAVDMCHTHHAPASAPPASDSTKILIAACCLRYGKASAAVQPAWALGA
jgi:hypothetical protein